VSYSEAEWPGKASATIIRKFERLQASRGSWAAIRIADKTENIYQPLDQLSLIMHYFIQPKMK
jgi:hypothetical protein